MGGLLPANPLAFHCHLMPTHMPTPAIHKILMGKCCLSAFDLALLCQIDANLYANPICQLQTYGGFHFTRAFKR